MSPDAMSRSSKNCSSVSSRAASGMLLMRARLIQSRTARDPADVVESGSRVSAQRVGTRPPSMISGISCLRPNVPSESSLSCSLQRLAKIFENVVDVFDAYAEPNHLRRDSCFLLFFGRQLPVSCRRRMACQRLRIAHIDHPLEKTECIETLAAALVAALYSEGQKRTEVVSQVSVRHRIKRVIGKAHVVYPFDHGMSPKKLRNLPRVLDVALHSKSHCLNPLQEQETVERRQCCSGVTLAHGSATRHESSVAEMIDVDHAVIRNLRLIKHVELFRILPPRKPAGVDDHSANARTRSSNELGHGVHNNVCAVLDWPEEDRRCHSVVDNQRYAMFVGDFRDSVDVCDVSSGIANAFAVNRTRVFVDQLFDVFGLVSQGKTRLDAALGKDVREQSISRSIKLRRGNDVISGLKDINQSIFNCCHSRADAQAINAALQSRHSLLENRICGIADPCVDISLDFKIEEGCTMLRTVELERDRLIDRHRHSLSRGVPVVSDVNGNRFRLHVFVNAERDLTSRRLPPLWLRRPPPRERATSPQLWRPCAQ